MSLVLPVTYNILYINCNFLPWNSINVRKINENCYQPLQSAKSVGFFFSKTKVMGDICTTKLETQRLTKKEKSSFVLKTFGNDLFQWVCVLYIRILLCI